MILDQWRAWIIAFDTAAERGDWSDAATFLTEDVVYAVGGVAFGCEIRGRDAVLAGFEKSIANFDRKFDRRTWEAVGLKVWDDRLITGRAKGDYFMDGKRVITFSAQSHWVFRDGKISVMIDAYDTSDIEAADTLAWLAQHRPDLDPSYV